jgi:ABC-type transporter Mla maintaining outer membrane lipid asymmetry ATPase subunit MlaF
VNAPVVIEMEGVAVSSPRNPDLPLLEPVDWRVEEGECWVVAGLPGSGKTSLLQLAAGLQLATRGHLRVLGEPVPPGAGEALTHLRRQIGVVFEGGGRLFPSLTVLENVVLPLRYHLDLNMPAAAAEIAPLMTELGLDRLASFFPGRIGHAWTRRVALARALALRPPILLLDNPMEGLDPAHLRWWRDFLGALHRGHSWLHDRPETLVITADDLRPLVNVGDQFALASNHQWRILGDRAAVLASTQREVRELLGESD